MRICIIQPTLNAISETFLRAHAERLPGVAGVVHWGPRGLPSIDGTPILSQATPSRAMRKLHRFATSRAWKWEITSAYLAAFRRMKCDVVLAQYGPTGIAVMEACRIAKMPLVVHFHGYDASKRDTLERCQNGFPELFSQAAAIIAVSQPMRQRLIDLGAPSDNVHINHYGVDVSKFTPSPAVASSNVFLAAGRLVDKKAPHLTLLAFAKVHEAFPDARLRIIGDGPLRGACQDLIQHLKISDCVEMLGAQPHEAVVAAMQQARAFVQHSVEASNGDCEGLPNSILEASASAIPVISTRHAGIPEAVIHGETGLLVDERDVENMATSMQLLAKDPPLAESFGKAGRRRTCELFDIALSTSKLSTLLELAISRQPAFGS